MGARIQALTACLVVLGATRCAPLGRSARSVTITPPFTLADSLAVSSSADSGTAVAFRDDPAEVEVDVDAEILWTLDRLLEDPVDLNRGRLDRLLELPWLARPHVDAIVRARPLPNVAALARLPGWDTALAERVAPFVHVGSGRDSWTAALRARVTRAQPVVTMRLESGSVAASLRSARDSIAVEGGFVAITTRPLRVVAGDVGLGSAQGLLLWSSASPLQTTSAPLRRPRGILGFEGASSRALRGIGLAVGTRRVQLQGVGGETPAGPVRGAAATLRLGRRQAIGGAWLHAGGADWVSASMTLDGEQTHGACEIVPLERDVAIALAAETRHGRSRFGARWQRTPRLALGPLAAIAASERGREVRQALVHGTTRWMRGVWEVGVLHATNHDTLGGRTTKVEQRLSGRWSFPAQTLEVRLRQRRTRTEELGLEGSVPATTVRQRGVVVRVAHRLGDATRVALDYRAEENVHTLEMASGSAWQLRVIRTLRGLETQAALTSFSAPAAAAAPVVPEPGVGAGGTSRRLVGDGVRAAGSLRLRWQSFDCGIRAACTLGAGGAERPEWSAAFGIALP